MIGAILRRLEPGSAPQVYAASRLASKMAEKYVVPRSDILITLLSPKSETDQNTFVKILTDERIVYTSSWIDKWFGMERLKQSVKAFSMWLELASMGYNDVPITNKCLERYKAKEKSAEQLGLENFFSHPEHIKKLREIYLDMTAKAEETGLGYFKFERMGELVGGGGLVPVYKKDEKPDQVDIALHILVQKRGIGSACLEILLEEAFERRGVSKVWGSSILNHHVTPNICSRIGMVMSKDEETKVMRYHMSDDMWKARVAGSRALVDARIAATHYAR